MDKHEAIEAVRAIRLPIDTANERRAPRILVIGCLLLALVACVPPTSHDSALEDIVGVEDLALPGNWHEVEQGQSPSAVLESMGAREGYYRVWMPEGETYIRIHLAAYRFTNVSAGRRGYRRWVHELRDHGCGTVSEGNGREKSGADDYAVFCCSPSVDACDSVQRYANIVVTTSVMEGYGIESEQIPDLFAVVDEHVEQVMAQMHR